MAGVDSTTGFLSLAMVSLFQSMSGLNFARRRVSSKMTLLR
jgi:hypothetical protein